jgi:hypothetical protein
MKWSATEAVLERRRTEDRVFHTTLTVLALDVKTCNFYKV